MALERWKGGVPENRKNRTTYQVDNTTGEVLTVTSEDCYIIPKNKRKARGFTMGFDASYREVTDTLARSKQSVTLYMFNALFTELESDTGLIKFHAKEYSLRLNCSVSACYKAIALLQGMKVVKLVSRAGSLHTLMMNPSIVWKGSIAARDIQMQAFHDTSSPAAEPVESDDSDEEKT